MLLHFSSLSISFTLSPLCAFSANRLRLLQGAPAKETKRMSFGSDWSGSPHANVSMYEEATKTQLMHISIQIEKEKQLGCSTEEQKSGYFEL